MTAPAATYYHRRRSERGMWVVTRRDANGTERDLSRHYTTESVAERRADVLNRMARLRLSENR